MSAPIVFISSSRLKPGRQEAFEAYFREGLPRLEHEKPATSLMSGYLSEDGDVVHIVHAFADAAAMDLHFEGAAERAKGAYELMDPLAFVVYGTPSTGAVTMLRGLEARGVTLVLHPQPLGGFARFVGR